MTIDIEKLVEDLMGTCGSISDYVDEDKMTQEDCQKLDNLVFCCDVCGWWYETGQMADTEDQDNVQICEGCADE